MANLEVRIRHEDEPDSIPLTEIPFGPEAIDSVVSTVKAWGLTYRGDGEAGDRIYGQFAVQDGRAFFEIVVPD